MRHLNDAIERVQMGPEKKSHIVSDEDKRLVACHEAGHAIVGELLDGSKDLAEGMAKFDEEGIQKLTSLTDGDLGDIVDRLEAVQDYAKEYKSYGGCPAGLECSTKLIYKTDSIGE